MKIHILDPLNLAVLNPLQKLYNSDLILVHKGARLDLTKSPKDLLLEDEATV